MNYQIRILKQKTELAKINQELLEALKALMERCDEFSPYFKTQIEQARQAISKAEGKTNE